MSTTDFIPVTERLSRLLDHLGIERAHVAAAGGLEPGNFAQAFPERIASMTYVCPSQFTARPLRTLSAPLLLIHGDAGPASSLVPRALPELPHAQTVTLKHFVDALWSDPVADRQSEVGKAMLAFLAEVDQQEQIAPLDGGEKRGEIAGITFRARGNGPPLLLFPLNLAPSQWGPLIPLLSQHYRTFVLGGAFLWGVAQLEQRFQASDGVRSFVQSCAPQPGERFLDVGCGSGVVGRWLAQCSDVARPIIGVDINAYLLREAEELAAAEGVDSDVEFRVGNAEALPFPDESFDVTLAFTVLEEGDADQMLAEMVRVTRPGGRVGVTVRATDMGGWDSLDLPLEIRAKFGGGPGYGADSAGCADASLYRRMRATTLVDLEMGPQLSVVHANPRLESVMGSFEYSNLAVLNDEEAEVWRAAAARALEEGTYLFSGAWHCAVGTKP